MWASDRAVQFYARAKLRNRFCAHRFGDLEFVTFEFARCAMLSVRDALACIDEFKQNGFEDNQARVLAMAIDETVGDRLNDVMSRIDARFDGIDARFDGIDARFKGIDSEFRGINAKLDSRKYEIVVNMTILSAALGSVGMLIYDIFFKPLLG